MAPAEQLNTYLASNSYLGSPTGATLEDYKQCKEISPSDAQKFPHLARWHSHISALMSMYPEFDWRGDAIPKGTAPKLGGAEAAAPKKEAAPKKDAAPKKEAAPKKDAAPKKEGKKEEKKKEEKKEEKAPTPEDLEKAKKDKLKKTIKEGGKRGVEIEGAADMGGLQFFCTAVDLPEGDLELLQESMTAMNAKSDPTEEERKGGSGHIGKMIFSAGAEQLAVCAYVPEEKVAECSCEEWLKSVLSGFNGQVASTSKNVCTGFVKTDADKGVFPLKIREPMIMEANNFLRKKGLFPEDKESDDEFVFGDDDFPA